MEKRILYKLNEKMCLVLSQDKKSFLVENPPLKKNMLRNHIVKRPEKAPNPAIDILIAQKESEELHTKLIDVCIGSKQSK